MNDDLSLDVIDERGRAAAAGLRAAATDRAVPVFDPDVVRIAVDAPTPRLRRLPLLAAAAVLVVLAVAAVVAGTGGDDGGLTEKAVAPTEPGRFRLGAVPDGWSVVGVRDEPLSDASEFGTATLYGPDRSRPLLSVGALPEDTSLGGLQCEAVGRQDVCAEPDPDVPSPVSGLPALDVTGRRAWDPSATLGAGSLVVEVAPEVLVLVIGASLSPDTLADVAAGVEVTGGEVVAQRLPDGFSALGGASLTAVLGPAGGVFGATTGVPTAGWSVWYSADEPVAQRYATIAVSVSPGSAIDVGLAGVMAAEATEVEVRGQDALLFRMELDGPVAGTWWSARWEESPGQVVEVVAATSADQAFTSDDLLSMAEGIEPVDDSGVADLRQQVADRGLTQPGVTVIGEGTFSDGSTWKLVHGLGRPEAGTDDLPEAGLSLRTAALSGGTTSSSQAGAPVGAGEEPPEEPLGQESAGVDGPAFDWQFGAVTDPTVARVTVERNGEQVAEATIVRRGDRAGWVAEVPEGTLDQDGLEAVAYAADGTELDRLPL